MAGMSQLGEALTAGQAGALVQKRISPLIVDLQRRFSVFVTAVPTESWDSTVYNFNRRLQRPGGGFVTDGGAVPMSNSVWEQKAFTLRNMQAVGAVTGYAQAVTRSLVGDLEREEYEATAESLVWDIETALGWGCAGATQYGPAPQFDGLNSLVTQFASTSQLRQNAIETSGASFALTHLDHLYDLVRTNAAMNIGSNYMFVMTPTAQSRFEQLLVPEQRFVNQVEIAAGIMCNSYKGVPIVPSSFLGNTWAASMGTVTGTPGTTGGTLAAGDYYYVVVPIMSRAGRGNPSTEVHVTTTGTTSTVSLAFTPPVGPEGSVPLHYEVYRGSSTGQEVLLGVVDATPQVQGDNVTRIYATGITDTGTTLVPTWNSGSQVPTQYPASYQNGSGAKLPVGGGEDIYLIPRDKNIMCRPIVRDIQPVQVAATVNQPDARPFALVSDTTFALRAERYVGRLRNVVTALS
ncbi:hypothetical protein LQ327_08965 [Actinomycetospora endophytica]|uniref:Capsid protein n=1 Tax=Actinomycetospora endophytica TaxID=2291215 RepID=A0ABS8P5H6_9PSEU|nr:hypothetical protein [Actinomycetospora endophytica]MCD2193512.1 hypothetical protein [Actinomycetospora endophytica]